MAALCPDCNGKMPCPDHSKSGKVAGAIAKNITKMKGMKKK